MLQMTLVAVSMSRCGSSVWPLVSGAKLCDGCDRRRHRDPESSGEIIERGSG